MARLIEWLTLIGISVYEYGDWKWARRAPGKVRYSSSGSDLDPMRFAIGDPEPFRRQTWEEVPDQDALLELVGSCRVVALIGPRSGSPSQGVHVELQLLPSEPAVVLVSWGEHNDWLVRENRHGYLYRIHDVFDDEQKAAALDLAHTIWLHWVLDHMACEGKSAGRGVLLELARRDSCILRILRFSGRLSGVTAKTSNSDYVAAAGDLDPALVTMAESMRADEARPVVRHWWGRASLHAALPTPGKETAALVQHVSKSVDTFCEAALRRHPELADEKADGLRMQASHKRALGNLGGALRHFDGALRLPGLSNAARSEALADRAAMTSRSSAEAAQEDIEEILSLSGASVAAKSQALWLRANSGRCPRRGRAPMASGTASGSGSTTKRLRRVRAGCRFGLPSSTCRRSGTPPTISTSCSCTTTN